MLDAMPASAVQRMSAYLGRVFKARMVISTVFKGPRDRAADPAFRRDVGALAEAVPGLEITQDPADLDLASGEPAPLSFIRQLEGHPPVVPAAMMLTGDDVDQEALREAEAMGFVVGPPLPADLASPDKARPAAPRLGLLPPPTVEVLDPKDGLVRFGAGTSWAQLASSTAPHGVSARLGLPEVYPRPIEAAAAGAFGAVDVETRQGSLWGAEVRLSPDLVGLSERTWVFHDLHVAEAVLERVVRIYRPHFAETIPAIDAGGLVAGQLWDRHKRFNSMAAGGLRVVFAGPKIARRAALIEASWGVERAGGVCHYRKPLAPRRVLDALAVAAGAARITRSPHHHGRTPEGAVSAPKVQALLGQIEHQQVLWYPRELAHSLEQAHDVLGLSGAPLPALTTANDPPIVLADRTG